MSDKISLTGMIIYAAPSGEYDKRVVILTKERGKITAFARGARRPKSMLLACSSVFAMGVFELFEGRDAYSLVGADIWDYFPKLSTDLEGSFYGSYFLEFAGYYSRENLGAADMLNLLYVSLKALERHVIPRRLIRYLFEIRLMVMGGEYPQDLAWDESLRETSRYAMQQAIRAPLEKLYSFNVSGEVLDEIARVQDSVRRRTLDRELKSLQFLEGISLLGD